MVDIKHLRLHPEDYKRSAKLRGVKVDIDALLKTDKERTELIGQVEKLRSKLNVKGKPTPDQLKGLQKTKAELEPLEGKLKKVQTTFDELISQVPNLVSKDTPEGKDESENRVMRQVGEKSKFDFTPKPHWEIGERLEIIDNERAAKTTGSRFTYLKGGAARLQFALIQFVIDKLTDEATIKEIIESAKLDLPSKPFTLVVPPVMVRPEVMQRMARLEPREERYHIPSDDLYLIGSAEHTLGPLHMDEIVAEDDLPIRYLGYSTSFRREAGSYGKDVRGILRVHQFDKLEMETFSTPETSIDEQNLMVAIQEYLAQELELPYQVVAICTGDMGDPDYRQIDIEIWMSGQNRYRETHTADLMTDYQSRRLNVRYKNEEGKTDLVHMNDATAAAIGRLLIAILENNQTKDGGVKIPKALQSYYGKDTLT